MDQLSGWAVILEIQNGEEPMEVIIHQRTDRPSQPWEMEVRTDTYSYVTVVPAYEDMVLLRDSLDTIVANLVPEPTPAG